MVVQRRGGSDHLEKAFGGSCAENVNDTAQGTNGQMANNMGGAL